MIRKKRYFMIVWGVLVLVVSVGPFARPHQVLNNNVVAVANISTSSEAVSINNETSLAKEEFEDEKNTKKINYTVKADGTNTTLSRGGSVSKAINASSAIISWPLNGPITSGFGLRSRDNHTGIDIAASIGTPIKAACDGKVVFNGWQDGYGKLLIIQASNGIQTYYGHTSAILVNVGQTVSRGQVVAKVGMTGRTTGPHVHFEVRKNGTPQNPLNYLK